MALSVVIHSVFILLSTKFDSLAIKMFITLYGRSYRPRNLLFFMILCLLFYHRLFKFISLNGRTKLIKNK